MRPALALLLVAACKRDAAPQAPPAERDRALVATTQCTDTVDSLAPSYQMVGPRLSSALKLDRMEAQRLMRDSIELLISTRELLCNLSAGTVDEVHGKFPGDREVTAAHQRMVAAQAKLGAARKAYDALLGATSAAQAPVDQDALLDRFSNALLGR
jgi:hypothetical protein